ncbi:hypothetical protein [Corynebacterium variabile]|nr:hypothetical protein [Corynebacterium variabile]
MKFTDGAEDDDHPGGLEALTEADERIGVEHCGCFLVNDVH